MASLSVVKQMNTVGQVSQKKRHRVNFLNLPSLTILGSDETQDDYEITARPNHPADHLPVL
jgi:hypothetical protein